MTTFEAEIVQIVPEAPGTVTLLLDAPVGRDYQAGQFLNVDPHRIRQTAALAQELEERKGRKERPRAYSLASAPHEALFAITVKEEPTDGAFPPLLSPYLVHEARPGDRLPCAGFAGLYGLPADLPAGSHVVHLCAGSGIVPNFGILKDALHRDLPVRHTLLYANRRWDDVIFRAQIGELARRHPDRLEVVHALSREAACPPDVQSCAGRLDGTHLRRWVPDLPNALFLVCGPSIPEHERRAARARGEKPHPRFLEAMKALLLDLGVPKERILTEGW